MTSPDLQRIRHIMEYCVAIEKTIERYGNSFEIYAADADYQRAVGAVPAGNREPRPVGPHEGHAKSGCP